MNRAKAYIRHKDMIYYPTSYYTNKYDVTGTDMRNNRITYGLPFVKAGENYYYNEQEFNDFYAGKIGKPTREYNRKEA